MYNVYTFFLQLLAITTLNILMEDCDSAKERRLTFQLLEVEKTLQKPRGPAWRGVRLKSFH